MPEFIVAIDHITYYAVQAEMKSRPSISSWRVRGKRFPPRRAMPISARIRAATATTRVTPRNHLTGHTIIAD